MSESKTEAQSTYGWRRSVHESLLPVVQIQPDRSGRPIGKRHILDSRVCESRGAKGSLLYLITGGHMRLKTTQCNMDTEGQSKQLII